MKTNCYLLGFALFMAGAMPTFSQVSNDNEDGVYKIDDLASRNDFVEGQLLVKFKDDNPVKVSKARGMLTTNVGRLTNLLEKYGANEMEKVLPNEKPGRQLRKARAFNGEIIHENDLSQLYQVKLSKKHAQEVVPLIKELQALDEVEYAEPNYRLYTLDATIASSTDANPYKTNQWYLDDYGVTQLWDKPIINSTRPVIAILDTGVDITHPDLVDNIWTNQLEAEGAENYDNDGNSYKSDVHGWDFINNSADIHDFNMHGTHVAGIAAAANNEIGIVGANPKALIMPVTVMQSDGIGDVSTIVKGIRYAVANGATILNMSIGTYANSRALRQALENAYQSAVIVAAAGNDNKCINTPHYPEKCDYVGPLFPAAYSFVLGVQATVGSGELVKFSNYDDDGNTFSSVTTLQDPDGFNYELKAPGVNMLSTIPGGKYKELQGTSMATPLVAGAISALKMVKQYDNQEILWGDLLNTDNIAGAYAVTSRPAELDLIKVMYRERKELDEETEENYSGDGRIDAGETVSIFPVIRTTFGEASHIKMKLEMGDEFEDPNTVQILSDGWVDFGLHLDAYGKGVSLNPLTLKVAENVANGRHIKMKVVAMCDESSNTFEKQFTMVIDNMRKIYGSVTADMTLDADHEWLVSGNVAVNKGVTLTIEPGTTVRFADDVGISSAGTLNIHGTPEKPIILTKNEGGNTWGGILGKETISYCKISYWNRDHTKSGSFVPMENCQLEYISGIGILGRMELQRSNLTNSYSSLCYTDNTIDRERNIKKCNIINNVSDNQSFLNNHIQWSALSDNNFINNGEEKLGIYSESPVLDKNEHPCYIGTSIESLARLEIYDVNTSTETFGTVDLSNMRTTPIEEAHGMVWKVVVNGLDAQDQYDELDPLGVGKHKFEVYFNRPMNKAVAPQISFGVRDPWTQHSVAEEGEGSGWNEAGTIYTAYKTITGKTKSDGINRIYVQGAEDDEYFEIPYEKTRFNVMINAAGSMATGFAAEAGLGRVNLTWDNSHNNFDDAMGFNIYRFSPDITKTIPEHFDREKGVWVPAEEIPDTVRINQEIVDIETTDFTDYDVTPKTTYYYLYKVLSTDLKEYDVSNVVAATPLTSTRGDANGSGEVDVADVISTVNYAAGMDPKPFIFEAADMNKDQTIDILDIVGIIQGIINPSLLTTEMTDTPEAVYSIEDGTVYVDSPVALAGVQVQLATADNQTITVADNLKGFEQTSAWLSDNDYLFLAYNLNGKTLTPGKHALLHIGDAEIAAIRLSDSAGRNVTAVSSKGGDPTGIDRLGKHAMSVKGVYNLNGQKISGSVEKMKRLPKGVYIIDGVKVVK